MSSVTSFDHSSQDTRIAFLMPVSHMSEVSGPYMQVLILVVITSMYFFCSSKNRTMRPQLILPNIAAAVDVLKRNSRVVLSCWDYYIVS